MVFCLLAVDEVTLSSPFRFLLPIVGAISIEMAEGSLISLSARSECSPSIPTPLPTSTISVIPLRTGKAAEEVEK